MTVFGVVRGRGLRAGVVEEVEGRGAVGGGERRFDGGDEVRACGGEVMLGSPIGKGGEEANRGGSSLGTITSWVRGVSAPAARIGCVGSGRPNAASHARITSRPQARVIAVVRAALCQRDEVVSRRLPARARRGGGYVAASGGSSSAAVAAVGEGVLSSGEGSAVSLSYGGRPRDRWVVMSLPDF